MHLCVYMYACIHLDIYIYLFIYSIYLLLNAPILGMSAQVPACAPTLPCAHIHELNYTYMHIKIFIKTTIFTI